MVTNYNRYESKRYFAEKLLAALQRQGLEVIKVDSSREGPQACLTAIQQFAPDLVCTFHREQPDSEGKFWWDYFLIPHLSMLLDPACYSLDLLVSPLSIISCVDRQDIATMHAKNIKKAFFFPHAVERELAPDPYLERVYEVVFFGSCYDYESLRTYWGGSLPLWASRTVDDAIDRVFSNGGVSLTQALLQAGQANPTFRKTAEYGLRTFCFRCLDTYTRGKDRIELIRSIKKAHVHVFGELEQGLGFEKKGWSHYLGKQSNVTLHPAVSYSEALQIMKQSKVVLNSMPFFLDGSHERVFAALACGALPVSSASGYLREELCEGEEIEFYPAGHYTDVSDRIDAWLGNEAQRQAAVVRGREKVMQRHTWDQRAELLVSEVEKIIAG